MTPNHERFVVLQEPDRLERRKLVIVTVTSIVVAATAAASAWGLLAATRAPVAAATAPPPAGTVETTLIETTARGLRLRADQEQALQRYGWVDRDRGLARIPIERAMDIVADHPAPPDRALVP